MEIMRQRPANRQKLHSYFLCQNIQEFSSILRKRTGTYYIDGIEVNDGLIRGCRDTMAKDPFVKSRAGVSEHEKIQDWSIMQLLKTYPS